MLWAIYLEMKSIVLDLSFTYVTTPFIRRPISLANEVDHICVVGPWLSCLYSSDAPVCRLTTELIACMVPYFMINGVPVTMSYREEIVELPLDNMWRLLVTYCWILLRVG